MSACVKICKKRKGTVIEKIVIIVLKEDKEKYIVQYLHSLRGCRATVGSRPCGKIMFNQHSLHKFFGVCALLCRAAYCGVTW